MFKGVCHQDIWDKVGFRKAIYSPSVLAFQCHIECRKEEVSSLVEHLPKDSKGRVSIDDFCRTPILSEEVFKLMDKVRVDNKGSVEVLCKP